MGSGFIYTLVGTGDPGFKRDDGEAGSACLNEPKGITLDRAGHLYIADSENHAIRRVDLATRRLTTIVGGANGGSEEWESPAPSRDEGTRALPDDPLADPDPLAGGEFRQATDISGMMRYVVGKVEKSARFHGDGGQASQAMLNFPSATAVDSRGNLYIADTRNHRVRKVDAATGIIETMAGTGQAGYGGDGGPAVSAVLNEPCALVVDHRDRLFLADQSNNRVRMIDLATGVISTVAGTGESGYSGEGPATQAALAGPSGLAVDREGTLYIADTFNGRIRRVDLASGTITTILGDGGAYQFQGDLEETALTVSRPYGIAVDGEGNVLLTDSDNHLIRRWNRARNTISVVAGVGRAEFHGEASPAQSSAVNYPFDVAVDEDGTIYIADTFNHRIRAVRG